MTDTTHTPGPWVARASHIHETSSSFGGIATVQTFDNPDWEANARLIAACPKMLAALQAVADYWDGGPYYNKPGEVEALFRAAIAEATGQAD